MKNVLNKRRNTYYSLFRLISVPIALMLFLAGCSKTPDLPGPYDPIDNPDDINGLENLGSGYDVFEKFADVSQVKAQILDYRKLSTDGLVEKKTLEHSSFNTSSGTSITEYSQSLKISVGLSGSYMFFSGSVKTNFSSNRYSYDSYSFATYHSMINKYQLRLPTDWNGDDLKSYLKSQAKSKLNDPSISPQEIFQVYGTHCLTGLVVGGRLDYSVSARTSDLKENVSIGVYAEASFSKGFGSGTINTEVINETEYSQFAQSMEKHLEVYGGSSELGQHIINKDDYDAWINSINDNLVFCNFTQNGLIPVWEFCDDDARKAELQAAYATWASDRDIVVLPTPRACILDLKIVEGSNSANPYKVNGRDYYRLNYDLNNGSGGPYIFIYYLSGLENDTITPIAEVATINTSDGESLQNLPAGFQMINWDLNRGVGGDLIYLAYRRRNDYSDALVTGLMVNSVNSFGTSGLNIWYVVTAGYTSPTPQDLNEGAGGSTIYLYYTNDHIEESSLPGK
ncbi:MAG: MAC/perforin domain-containing protein [Bacteroidales bacterium]|nr:MAC/perforin domain-containing protein [Bacteroidales bacterium]